jgi:multidrug transporter EmrE-like cation transporter
MESRVVVAVLLFAAFTLCTSCGLLLFKHGWPAFQEAMAAGRWWSRPALTVALGAGLYAASFLLWLLIASRLPLTIAYPVAIGLSLVAITTGAVLWLGEPLDWIRIAGGGLILVGIALIVR